MGPLPRSNDGFIAQVARSFGTQTVTVVHRDEASGERRFELEAQVQSKSIFFDVDAPVYKGDQVELPDPRGGVREVWITAVDINQAGGGMPAHMSHIKAVVSDEAPRAQNAVSADQIIHGNNAIIVSGNHVTIAAHGGNITQGQPVPPEYAELAKAVKQALDLIEREAGFQSEEREIAQQAGSSVLEEIVKTEPDEAKLRGSLAALRGVLTAALNSAASASASGIIQQLFSTGA